MNFIKDLKKVKEGAIWIGIGDSRCKGPEVRAGWHVQESTLRIETGPYLAELNNEQFSYHHKTLGAVPRNDDEGLAERTMRTMKLWEGGGAEG